MNIDSIFIGVKVVNIGGPFRYKLDGERRDADEEEAARAAEESSEAQPGFIASVLSWVI